MTQSQHCNNDNNYNDDNAMCVSMWFTLMSKPMIYEEENMTTRSEIQTKNIRSLVIHDIREGMTLRRLILQSLERTYSYEL